MKIKNVILSTNFNKTYFGFWNSLSKLYKTKFDINPVLIFLGSEDELSEANLNSDYGQIIRHDNVNSKNPSWATTWALFYFTKLFPDDVCLIMGIDQIPMGTKFIKDYISTIDDDSYVTIIDDAYDSNEFSNLGRWTSGGISPSSYNIAKGYIFDKILGFEETFQSEITKIENLYGTKWGVDELYLSKKLFENKNQKIVPLSKFKDLKTDRLECNRTSEPNYDINKLKNNGYIECHACRPFDEHQNYLENLFFNIDKNLNI